ncbi:hypothetical protein [Desulfosediminicola ganghwensis]|uniref:hypothetical protein n=1 Tax=Desulfosediminicola ganghwensis TaxID=2569540 RepID=UPI0010ACB9F6|nr:hypothetical protein [Desulfosediminicola ganghwensis]
MREAIKRIVLRMFPELAGGYHLDRFARIVKISDSPAGGETSDRFKPKFAADIEILTPDGNPAEGFPLYEAVPLQVPAAGENAGMFHWPSPGTIVTVRWIEGRADHPVIQHIYAIGRSLPAVPDKMGRWQQADGVYQVVDPAGNWERKTGGSITDSAATITENATGNRTETVGGSSTENVSGSKTTTAGGGYHVSAPKISISAPGGPSLLPELTGALDALATHTHPGDGQVSSVSSSVLSDSTSAGSASTNLQKLQ